MQKKNIYLFLILFSFSFAQRKIQILQTISFEKPLKLPRISPDGKLILATTEGNLGLYVFDIQTGALKYKFKEEQLVGYHASWGEDAQHINFRANRNSLGQLNILTAEETYKPLNINLVIQQFQSFEQPYLYLDKNLHCHLEIPLEKKSIVANLEQVYQVVKSKDNQHFILHSGADMYLFDNNFELQTSIPSGLANSFSNDNAQIIFERSASEGCGHLSHSELYIYDRAQKTIKQIDLPSSMIPLAPTFTNNDRQIVFENEKDGSLVHIQLLDNE